MRIPVLKFDTLWHIGELDPNQKFNKGSSLEGNLFSMSRCPAAWRRIVKLGGLPLYQGDLGYTLLDLGVLLYPRTQAARQLRAQMLEWAKKEHLLTPRAVLKGYYEDCELEETVYRVFSIEDLEEAQSEQYEKVVQDTILTATDKLRAIHNLTAHDHVLKETVDFAMIEWARAHAKDQIDGVYWDEQLEPLAYSAPRAGLFEARAESLRQIDSFPCDEDDLVERGRIQWIDLSSDIELSR